MAYQLQTSDLKSFNQFMAQPQVHEHLQTVLADKKNVFVNNLTALVANNENLQKCVPATLMYAAIKATALDLPLDQNLGFAYVIPYNNGKTGKVEAQFQLGYKAFVQLAMRSGQFKTINVREVRDGEIVDEDFVTGEMKFKRAEHRESLAVIGYVAYFELVSGFRKMLYMSKGEVESHGKKYSKTYNNGQWSVNFDAMAQKTVLKLLLSKYAPLSVDMQKAVTSDQSVMRQKSEDNIADIEISYVDNDKTEEAHEEEQKEMTAQQKAVAEMMNKQSK